MCVCRVVCFPLCGHSPAAVTMVVETPENGSSCVPGFLCSDIRGLCGCGPIFSTRESHSSYPNGPSLSPSTKQASPCSLLSFSTPHVVLCRWYSSLCAVVRAVSCVLLLWLFGGSLSCFLMLSSVCVCHGLQLLNIHVALDTVARKEAISLNGKLLSLEGSNQLVLLFSPTL